MCNLHAGSLLNEVIVLYARKGVQGVLRLAHECWYIKKNADFVSFVILSIGGRNRAFACKVPHQVEIWFLKMPFRNCSTAKNNQPQYISFQIQTVY